MQILKSSYNQLPSLIQQGAKLTPMMEQFHEIKLQYPEALLFFRMGDFFELFFEDAVLASKHLNITLTARGQILNTPVPMCGIPHHAAANYVDKLTSIGLRIVICDQIENPKFAKGIVKRAVVQICSPGLPYDIDRSNTLDQHFVACASIGENVNFLAMVDFVHGDFFLLECQSEFMLHDYLKLYRPKEFLTYFGQFNENNSWENLWDTINTTPTYLSQEYFDSKNTIHYRDQIAPYLKFDSQLKNCKPAQDIIFSLCYYLFVTQKIECSLNLKKFRWIKPQNFMSINSNTLTGLEILPKNKESYSQSLIGWCDHTKTSMGFRQLKEWFLYPQKNLEQILWRQQQIKTWIKDWSVLESVRQELEKCRDIHRILAKSASGKITASDMINLSRSFGVAQTLKANYASLFIDHNLPPKLIQELLPICLEINKAINDEIGATLDKGNLFNIGYNKNRDALANIHVEVEKKINKLEEKYKKSLQLNTLRIRSNNISGYYIEVSKNQGKNLPKNFERLQTLTNVERFISPELKNIQNEVFKAKDQLLEIDLEIFKNFQDKILKTTSLWLELAQWLSTVDVIQSMAFLAEKENLTCPQFTTEKNLELKGLWHPLLKDRLKDQLITHNIHFNEQHYFALITGPNMAGKTTVMREVAISAFLAQIGSFVPASSAVLPLFDALFSRLGANDDILNGQSTFMVEMSEASDIIRNATSSSLILIDEIGRGTSTFDGLSLAQAIMQFLCQEVRAITLFSTHYHELIQVAEATAGAKNYTIKTALKGKDVVFLYELIDGGAKQSFGIHVAKLAGLPKKILQNAESILQGLESSTPEISKPQQIEIFDLLDESQPSEIEMAIKELNLNNISPIDALLKIKTWQDELKH